MGRHGGKDQGTSAAAKRLLLIGALVIIALYARGLGGGFVWDDRTYFLDNDILTALGPGDFMRVLLEPMTHWGDHMPLTNYLFVLEYNAFGLWSPGYHMVSIVLYLALGYVTWLFLRTLYGMHEGSWRAETSALIALALFMLHPVHVEVVSYITGQKDLLCAIFSLLCVIYVARSTRERAALNMTLATISYWLAFMAKDAAVANAIFVPAFWLVALRRPGQSVVKPALLWTLINAPAIAWVLMHLADINIMGNLADLLTGGRIMRSVSVVGAHAWLSMAPWPLSFGYPFEDAATFGADFVFGLIVIAALVYVIARRTRSLQSVAALVFLCFLFPVMQLVLPFMSAMVYDRYLVVAVLGLCIALERGLSFVRARVMRPWPKVAGAAVALIAIAYSGITLSYIPKFHDDVASLEHSYKHFPGWKRPAFEYVYALIEAARYDDALRVTAAEPTFDEPDWVRDYFRGWILVEQGRPGEALVPLMRSSYTQHAGGYYPFSDLYLGRAYIDLGEADKARFALKPILAEPRRDPIEYYKARQQMRRIEPDHR